MAGIGKSRVSVMVTPLTGDALKKALPALASLRIKVFHEWPYLYDGSLEYEQKYLDKFSKSDRSIIVAAKDGDTIIGAATASPLLGHADSFARPFADKGFAPEKVFYFGESVLLPEYRGQGIGHKFFDAREQHARGFGDYEFASFCAVVRSPTDPRKPKESRTLDDFWGKRGFSRVPGLITTFAWKESGSDHDVENKMQFWVKKL